MAFEMAFTANPPRIQRLKLSPLAKCPISRGGLALRKLATLA